MSAGATPPAPTATAKRTVDPGAGDPGAGYSGAGDASTHPGPVGVGGVDAWTVSMATTTAAALVALTSTGSMVVAAVLLAVATRRRILGLVALVAVASVGVRFSTVAFDDLAGVQSVLGPAGSVGPATGAVSSWAAAAALVLSARRIPDRPVPDRPVPDRPVPDRTAARGPEGSRYLTPTWSRRIALAVTGLASGGFAAAVVAGPGPSDLLVRVAASAVAVALAVLVAIAASVPAAGDGPSDATGEVSSREASRARARDRALTGTAALAAVVAVVTAAWPA